LSTTQLAAIYKVSTQTIRKWVRKRHLPCYKTFGGNFRFDPVEIRDFCAKNGIEAPPEIIELTEAPNTPTVQQPKRARFYPGEELSGAEQVPLAASKPNGGSE